LFIQDFVHNDLPPHKKKRAKQSEIGGKRETLSLTLQSVGIRIFVSEEKPCQHFQLNEER